MVLPMFRAYARFGVVVQLMAALLAGLGVDRLWMSSRRGAKSACVALVMLAATEYAVWPPAMSRDVLPTAAHRWVMTQPGPIRVLDCVPLTSESESIPWLSGDRIALRRGWFDDCAEPNIAEKLAASGFTHMLIRADASEAAWLAGGRTPEGLGDIARFFDAQVFAVAPRTPSVFTAQMRSFYAREYGERWTWRWMASGASWNVVNRTSASLTAIASVEMAAFAGARGLHILLDGSPVETLIVAEGRAPVRLGPFAFTPGDHTIGFEPTNVPTVANEVLKNGDRRALSIAFGDWHWSIEAERP
jgi:hypothetical protein